MSQVDNSIHALNTFKDGIKNLKGYGDDGFKFEGYIKYTVNGKVETERLEVYLIIGGYNPMVKLDIYEKGNVITLNKYHLDFDPEFWKNTVFKNESNPNRLIIEGFNSPKLGNYTVEIEELV